MSKLDRFEIELEHDIDEQYQYEPGEILRGTVIVRTKDEVRIKGINLQIKGEASVSWDEKHGAQVKADEIYLEETITLLQSPNVDSITLDQGLFKYPFQFPLPQNLPSSFIGKYGSVTYVLKATLREDSKFGLNPTITSEPFLVLRRLDITNDASLLQPIDKQVTKRLWGTFAFCMSGRLQVTLKLNRRAFLPGEDILLDATVDNSSPRQVHGVQASLVMLSRFYAQHKFISNMQTVNKRFEAWDMGSGEERIWKNVKLTVPPYIPECRLDGCDVIDIEYELQLRVDIDKNKPLFVSIPVVIGTVRGGNKGLSASTTSIDKEAAGARQNRYQKKDQKAPEIKNNMSRQNGSDDDDDMDGIEFEMNAQESEEFRRPMDPGGTRKNPIFVRD